jgi:enamine deaminase RidA (YjgF/YER057c/UK114 family)
MSVPNISLPCPQGEPRTDDYDPHPPYFRGRPGRCARCAGYGGGAVSGPVASADETGSALDRLQALGLALPGLGGDSTYVNHRTVDASIYISGQLPYKDGELLGQGIVGRDIEVQTARGLARQAALNALAVAAQAVGDLNRIRIVQMLVFVASTPELGEQSRVADAASDLLVEVLGENGRHARTAIGVAGLPRNSPVEIQMVCAAA